MTGWHVDPRTPLRPEDAVVVRLESLGSRLAPAPSPEYRAATRARLIAMAAVRTPGDAPAAVRSPLPPPLRRLAAGLPRWRSRVTAGLAGAALTVGALGGVLAAAQGAAPGDLLYDVKRGGEQTQLALAGDATRGRALLDLAATRLTEVTALTGGSAPASPGGGRGPAGTRTPAGVHADLVVVTLATMDEQTTRGAQEVAIRSVTAGDAVPLADLAGWAARQDAGLTALTGAVPAPAVPALADSADLVAAVAQRATALVAALGCTSGPPTAGADDLGPVPAPCSPATARTATRDGSDAESTPGTAPGAPDAPAAAVQAGAGTADPGPSPAPGAATSASGSSVAVPAAPGSAGRNGAAGGGPVAPTAGPPSRGGLPLPLPAPRATPAPSATPSRPGGPPVVDLPLCVNALGLPVLC